MNPWFTPEYLRSAGRGAFRAAPTFLRGYVVAVKWPDEADFKTDDPVNGVLVDVQVVEPGWTALLQRVPVLVQSGGVGDHEVWRPQAATKRVDGGTFSRDPSAGQATPLHETDGDLVVVAFLGGDTQRPFVIGQLPHPKATEAGAPTDPEYLYRRLLAGALLGVKDGGEVRLELPDGGKLEVTHGDGRITFEADGKTTIVGPDDATVTLDNGKLTVSGGVLPTQPVALEALVSDLSTLVGEWYPIVQAAAALFGLALPNSAAIVAGLAAKQGPSGAYTAAKTESS